MVLTFVSVVAPSLQKVDVAIAANEKTQIMTVYYYSSFSNPYAYFQTVNHPYGELPGEPMKKVNKNLYKISLKVVTSEKVEISFNNGYDIWDDKNGDNYFISGKFKTVTILNGKMTAKAPDVKKSVSVRLVRPMAILKSIEDLTSNTGSLPEKTQAPIKTATPVKTETPSNPVTPKPIVTAEPTVKPTATLVVKVTPKPVVTEEPVSTPIAKPTTKPEPIAEEPKASAKPPVSVPSNVYKTNPTFGQKAAKAITIDGANNGEWSDANLIAVGAANDDSRSLGTNWSMHESPADMSHLWAAWDDENLYLAFQYVDVTDIASPDNAGSSNSEPIRVQPNIQSIAFDITPGEGSGTDVWGKNGKKPFWTGTDLPDYQIYLSTKIAFGFISKAVDGKFVLDDKFKSGDYLTIAAAGIEAKVGKGFAGTTLFGANDVDDLGKADKVFDFIAKGHDKLRDSFYEIKIPLKAIGNPDIAGKGIGVFLHQGEFSAIDTLPHDPATLDTPGTSESNSPKEWGDVDSFTVPFARIGKKQ